MATITFVISTPPYVNGTTNEAHDLIMASTAYGHDANVIFKGEGVLQLLKNQDPMNNQKHAGKRISGFTFFDIEPLYVCQNSLNSHKIEQDDLISGLSYISDQDATQAIEKSDFIIKL